MYITSPLPSPGEQTESAKSRNNRQARFLVAGSLPIPGLTPKKRTHSRSKFPARTMQNGLISPEKTLCQAKTRKKWQAHFLLPSQNDCLSAHETQTQSVQDQWDHQILHR